ncbi:unnamed protein product [Effrenium voratum]|nr:unnamed protein product [Effrenium voratum]
MRVIVPAKISDSTAVVVSVHGFGNHCNSERGIGCIRRFAEELDAIIFMYDQHGHGYSGGSRGFITDYVHLVDDLAGLVHLLYTAKEPTSDAYNLCSPEILSEVKGRELVLAGESIGGGVVLAASVRLQNSITRASALILFAPFLQATVPFGAGKSFVNMVSSFPSLGNVSLPQMFLPELKGDAIFANGHDVKIFEMDRSNGVRSALGFPKKLKASTGASITAMCNAMPGIITQLDTPVLMCCDPDDSIAPIQGPLQFMELATCPRELFKIPGGLHAPHLNKFKDVSSTCRRFLSLHLCRKSEALGQGADAGSDETTKDSSIARGNFAPSTAPQRLKLERTAFERFPLPGRFNEVLVILVYFATLLVIASSPTLLAATRGPEAGGWVLLAFFLYLHGVALVVVLNYTRAILKARRSRQNVQVPLRAVPFGILIPMYNEDIEILRAGLESINDQPQAPNVTVIIGLEARVGEEDNAKREEAVRGILCNVKAVHVFRHPENLPGHIKGCGSNQAWAMSQFLQTIEEDISEWVFMKVDAQVVMQPGLLTELEHRMLAWKSHRRPVVWQPMVLHTINNSRAYAVGSLFAQTVEFFVIGMFAQPLISSFVFGQYAMPMDLYVRAGTHHPSIMAEDQAITIQCSWTNRSLTVQPLNHSVAKAPPLGDSLREAIDETLAQDTRFFVGSVLILPWNLLHNPSTLSCCNFVLTSLFLRHFTTVVMPIMAFQSMFTVGFGYVRLPAERLEEAVNGIFAVFSLAGPCVTLLMAFTFAVLQSSMIAQWPGRGSQLSFKAIVNQILWGPALQLLVFLAEVRAFLLCIRYGSAGQTGPLQYRARKKVGTASMKGMPMERLEPTGSACKPVTVTCEVSCEAVDIEPGEQPFSV